MHIHHRRIGAIARDTLGGLWSPCSTSSPRRERLPTRLLLADRGGRRHYDFTLLPRVSILRKTDAPARSGPTDNTHHLAVCCMGSGPHRSLAEVTRGLLAPAGRHRQILQVDRGPEREMCLGPFLSILVIECQHKWTYVNLGKVTYKVQIK
jgi:hypothetical protein